jgi:hypothetical protein
VGEIAMKEVESILSIHTDELRNAPLRIYSLAAGVFGALVFLLLSLQPSPASFPCFDDVFDEYRHGLPFTYMTRRSELPNNGMTPSPCLPWPFFYGPPLIQIYPSWILVDAIVSFVVVVMASAPLGRWVSRRSRVAKVVIAILAGTCVLSWTLIALFAHSTLGPTSPMLSSWFTFAPAYILIQLLPAAIGVVYVLVAIGILLKWAVIPGTHSPWRVAIPLLNGVLLAFFLSYVVNDAFYMGSSATLLTLWATGTILSLAAVGAVRLLFARMGGTTQQSLHSRQPVALRAADSEASSTANRELKLSSWIVLFVVGWTTVYFCFFDMVTYVGAGNGQFGTGSIMLDTYGWPWRYMATYDHDAEGRAWAQEEGYPIDIFWLRGLVADVFFAAWATVGTWFTLQYFTVGIAPQLQFSLRTLLLLFTAIPIALYIPTAGDFHVLWPNWFAKGVLYFATACASFGLLLAIDRIIYHFFRRRCNRIEAKT